MVSVKEVFYRNTSLPIVREEEQGKGVLDERETGCNL